MLGNLGNDRLFSGQPNAYGTTERRDGIRLQGCLGSAAPTSLFYAVVLGALEIERALTSSLSCANAENIYALNNCRIRTTFRKSYQNGCMPCSNSKVTTPIAHMSTANPWGTRLTSSGAKYDCKVKKRAHRVQGRKGSAPTTFVCPGDYFNPVILMSGYIVSSILGGITFDQLSVYMSRVSRKTAVDVAKKIPGRFRD